MTSRRARLASLINQLPLFLGLVLLWMLLWGSFSWLNLVTGAVFAAVVSVVFYLPAVQLSGRVNPIRLVLYLVWLLFDIIRASIQVAYLAVAPHYRASNAILAIHLRTRSDLVLTWTAVSTSIVPGSIVIDTDRENSTLYLHVLDMKDREATERFRQSVLATERRIVLALGSREDVKALTGARQDSTRQDSTRQDSPRQDSPRQAGENG